jgi:hypothetical protein
MGHTVLDIVGMVPVVGTTAYLANTGWYAVQMPRGPQLLPSPIEGDVGSRGETGQGCCKHREGAKAERVIKDGNEAASAAENAEKALNAESSPNRGLPADAPGTELGTSRGQY